MNQLSNLHRNHIHLQPASADFKENHLRQTKNDLKGKLNSKRFNPRQYIQNYFSSQRCAFKLPLSFTKAPFSLDCKDLSIRQIRRQKSMLASSIMATFNQSRYYLSRKRHQERTFQLLEGRQNRIAKIRKQREQEKQEIQKKINQFEQRTIHQKMALKNKVDQAKINAIYSKHGLSLLKQEEAKNIREITQQGQQKIYKHKQQVIQIKRNKRNKVKRDERLATINHINFLQERQNEMKAKRHQRIMSQLREKRQIQLISSRIQEQASDRIIKYKASIDLYREKIAELKEQLGDSHVRLVRPVSKSMKLKNSCRQTLQEFNTRGRKNTYDPSCD